MKCGIVLISLLSAVNCARILVFSYVPSISHQNVFRALWNELSLRGHEVVAITTDPHGDSTFKNLTEIDVSAGYAVFQKYDYSNLRRSVMSPFSIADVFLESFMYAMELEIKTAAFQELLEKPSDYFDLIILDCHQIAALGIQNKFKAPTIAMCTLGSMIISQSFFGSPIHPVLYPELLSELPSGNSDMTIWQKIESLYITTGMWLYATYKFHPFADKEARKHFGQDMPYIEDLIRNISLLFLNINPVFSTKKNVPPNIIEYHDIHVGVITNLSSDLQEILDGAKKGVVYFSLGTNVRFDHVQGNIKEAILEALGELPYVVLCKWETEDFPGKPKNVILRKWFPQQAILAHPNVKAFVTQGGLQSSEEAIANGVPLVMIPFLGDQPMNAKILTKHGMAETISPKSLRKDILRDTILKVTENDKYRTRAQELRSIFLDQPQSGLDKIIWWCEYVIRHKGAKHLRSPSADISLYEYFMVDVFAVLFAALFVIYKLVSLALITLVGLLKGKKNTNESKKKIN